MKINRLGIVAIGLVLILVLTWLLRDSVGRLLTVPILYLAWFVRSIYYTLPQSLIWAVIIGVASAIALSSFAWRPMSIERKSSPRKQQAERRIATLVHYIHLSNRSFYRHRLKHALSELVLHLMSYEQQVAYQDLKMVLYRKELNMPPDMQQFIYDGLPMWPMGTTEKQSILGRFFQPSETAEKTLQMVEQVTQYLEARLEVSSDD
jgi:hypothetical protein